MLTTYKIDILLNGTFICKIFNGDHVVLTCFKHSRSYFQFESEKAGSFYVFISDRDCHRLLQHIHCYFVVSFSLYQAYFTT